MGESRGLGLDVLEFLPLLPGDMLGNKRVLGLDDGEVAWLNIRSCSRSKGFGLEGLNNLEGVIDDLVYWQAASDHMSSSATVINDNRAFLAMPSSAPKTPYFLEILPDLSASRGILHFPSRPPSALEALTKALWE